MAEKDKQYLTADDLNLLMMSYKNTVELSSSVLKQQEDIIRYTKEISTKLEETINTIYDVHEKTDTKNFNGFERVLSKIDTKFEKSDKDLIEQNERSVSLKDEVVEKLRKTQFTVWLGIVGLVGIIGTLLGFIYEIIIHRQGDILHLLTLITNKLGIVIQ
jgi:hypothetical protein